LSAENFPQRERLRLCCCKLPHPFYASFKIRARAGAVEFGIADRAFAGRISPIIPSGRPNIVGHFGFQISHAGIIAPGAAEECFHIGRFTCNPAIRKYEAKGLICGRRSGGNITVAQTMDVTFLKPTGRASENEIDVAGDVTTFKVMPTAIGEDGVLPAQEPTVAKGNSIAINPNRERLANRTRRIFKGDIFGAKIVCIDKGRGRAKGANRFAVGPGILAFKSYVRMVLVEFSPIRWRNRFSRWI
jgi:hypothetical protein